MAGDEREKTKKTWRERDASKDRSSHAKDERPRPGTQAGQRSAAAQQQYRSALEKLFDGGVATAGWSKVLPEMPKDPATEGRQELLRALRTAAGRTAVEKAVAALLDRFVLPDDPELLSQVLLHRDDTIVRQALGKLDALLPTRVAAGRAVLETRLRTLEEVETEIPTYGNSPARSGVRCDPTMTRDTILDPLVGLLDKVLKSKVGEDIKPIRLAREGMRAINDVLGQPVCSAEERAQRRIDRLEDAPPPPSVFRKHIP